MVRRLKLLLAHECSNEVSCDDTGRRPVLRGRFRQIREGQARLFSRQVCDPSLWCPLFQALEEGRNEGFPQRLSLVSGVTRYMNAHSC